MSDTDRTIALLAIAAGIVLALEPKTPAIVVVWSIVVFVLLTIPLVSQSWVEKSRKRQAGAVFALAVLVAFIGFEAWPIPPLIQVMINADLTSLPLVISPHRSIVVVALHPDVTKGFSEYSNSAEAPIVWPNEREVSSNTPGRDFVAVYQLQNLSAANLINVTLNFSIGFYEGNPPANPSGESGSGPPRVYVGSHPSPLLKQIDRQIVFPIVQPLGMLTLFLVNETNDVIKLEYPKSVIAQVSGETASRGLSMILAPGITEIELQVMFLFQSSLTWLIVPSNPP